MTEYRIVYNPETHRYRIERRGWLGWNFIMDEAGVEYLTFDQHEDACRFVCEHLRCPKSNRRWKVVDSCARHCPAS